MSRIYYPASRTVTIANAATVSDAEPVGLQGATVIGLITPAGLTGVALTFQVSMDGTDFFALKDSGGSDVSFTVTTSRAYYIDPIIFLPWNYLKVVSGSAESGGDVITLIVKIVQ